MQALITALIQARTDFQPIKKDKVNPAFKSRYATIDAVLDAVEPALTAHGLTIVQTTDLRDGQPVLITHLFHASGESISSTYLLPTIANNTEKTTSTILHERDRDGRELAPMNVDTKTISTASADPQKLGSAITYARRYALCAILSIVADEDDDGNAASKGSQPRSQTATPKTNPKPQRPQPTAAEPAPLTTTNRDRFVRLRTLTGHHAEQVKALCTQLNLPPAANSLNAAQCLQLRDAMLIDWALGQRRFNHAKHAQNSLDNVLTQFEQPPDDDALWVVWEEKVLAKPVLDEANA